MLMVVFMKAIKELAREVAEKYADQDAYMVLNKSIHF